MRGEILSYDEGSGTGLISGDDSIRYGFAQSAIQAGGVIAVGGRVDFVPEGMEATQIMILASTAPAAAFGQAAGSPTSAAPAGAYDFATALFSFDGRLRRQHFWISWLILFGVGLVLNFIPFLNMLGIVLLWPHLAIGVKRLHDMGKTGWLIAIPYVVMIAGWVFAFMSIGVSVFMNAQAIENEDPAVILSTFGPALGILSLTWLVAIGFWLWIGIADSQRGDNKYGPNPKGE
ncbi:DUF805 domain-containing protein [Brevundimonas guildfordensis]|uniref:DUF805 domain-containing protein n=1 Tax=Brevundimonas guildfordensis TaxID=2762241 RepID=A0ABR8R219_9CAUL|nr:DUF805 domain-containing protein [Brevundimonas guildfordensis]MBD7941850.1 DUF805 domain-containing protein [Brevundimonas guildfordensis]